MGTWHLGTSTLPAEGERVEFRVSTEEGEDWKTGTFSDGAFEADREYGGRRFLDQVKQWGNAEPTVVHKLDSGKWGAMPPSALTIPSRPPGEPPRWMRAA